MDFHYPVMVKEVGEIIIKSLHLKIQNWEKIAIFDGTLGHGWHVIYLHNLIWGHIWLYIATDADKHMYDVAKARIDVELTQERVKNIRLYNCSYTELEATSKELNTKYDVVFLDLGVNLWHFKQHERGFSIKGEGLLDMRYNTNSQLPIANSQLIWDIKNWELTGADIINTYSEQQLIDMFVLNSEISLPTSQKIAAEIVRMRKNRLFETSTQLNNLTKKLEYSARVAAIVFQAIRIEVNQEFQNIKYIIESCERCMNPGGILVILSYHSGEDRIVKEMMKKLKEDAKWDIVTKHAVPPTYQETQRNKPSRSARMRVFKFN